MKNKNIIMLLLTVVMISSATFTGCEKDDDTSANKNLVIKFIPNPIAPLSTTETNCQCFSANLDCNQIFGKILTVFYEDNTELKRQYVLPNVEINFGQFNEGTYEIYAVYISDTLYNSSYCMAYDGAFQIMNNQGKNMTINDFD